MTTSRRNFLSKSIVAAAGLPYAATVMGQDRRTATALNRAAKGSGKMSLYLFSKVLQWLDYEEMAAETVRAGFDGIELTVRPGGHVLPERVVQDLPRAVEIIRKAGLKEVMICTAIIDAADPFTEPILRTASSLGIEHYRMGFVQYEDSTDVWEGIKKIRQSFAALAALNERYRIKGSLQNHSGSYFGSPVWDLALVLQELGSPWLGCQYDIRHAIVEGAHSWPLGFELVKPYINTIGIKDFIWSKNEGGRWGAQNVPLGQGMVDFGRYFTLLKDDDLRPPVSLHYEYPLGGAESGKKTILMPKEEVLRHIRQDVGAMRKLLG